MFTTRPSSDSADNSALRAHHRHTDGCQRHQHGDHVSVDDDQDEQHADDGADLDDLYVFLTKGLQVGDGS